MGFLRRTPMKRTGFARPVLERAPRTFPKAEPQRFRLPALLDPRASVQPIEKHAEVRSAQLLEAVRRIGRCMHCSTWCGRAEPAHSNWHQHGKAGALKADDVYVAALCHTCHRMIDQGSRLDAEERQRIWWDALVETHAWLRRTGSWPAGLDGPNLVNPFPWAHSPASAPAATSATEE